MPSLRSPFPVERASVRDPEAQVGQLHRLAVAGGPCRGLTRLLRRVVQVDGENSAGQTGLFLSALLGHSSAVQLLLTFGANPNHRCLDGSTPVHAGAFSGRSPVMLHLLQAGGDLRLRDQRGRTPRDWAEQSDARQRREVLELLELCRARMAALVLGGEWAASASLGRPQASSAHRLCGSLSLLRRLRAGRAPRQEQIRRPPQIPALGFGQLSSLWPLGLVTGIPLADPKELLPAQGEPDRTYESSSHTLMANLLWRGHPVTARQLKVPGTQPDVLLADLQHCRPQQGSPWGGPGPGLPPPPELYPWLPLELICGDGPAATSDLYSFCILAQEVFTGELPWAGRKGPEVKAKLEAGESPALDPLVPTPYQALVQAGLGLGPADRRGSLQSTRYLLREAMAQDSAPAVSSRKHWTTLHPSAQGSPPETLYCEVAPRAKTTCRPVPPVMPPGPSPCQALETPEITGHSRVQRTTAWDSGSSLTLGSLSPSPGPSPGSSPAARVSLRRCLEPGSTVPRPELIKGGLFSSLQKTDLLEEVLAELQGGRRLRGDPSLDPTPDTDS
ncbi:inactive serine/threonine-protein kinase TEX14-like isoform X4 [Hyaena hyaena]|uniref:inactive serine/threonine-protein kinase TEX14-like isoform X4 n=1 Tax=Hyaena hyaena TaxID=95912 RepID=UPI001922F044|nr:inactive serine/threonine-protein kinase TEX14-like isoform X4 [Hyaena hyaena]